MAPTSNLYAWAVPAFSAGSPVDHTWVTTYDNRVKTYTNDQQVAAAGGMLLVLLGLEAQRLDDFRTVLTVPMLRLPTDGKPRIFRCISAYETLRDGGDLAGADILRSCYQRRALLPRSLVENELTAFTWARCPPLALSGHA